MLHERIVSNSLSEFMRYLAQHENGNDERLPALSTLSQELGVSIPSLREQLEVARVLGLVEVRPRTGMKRLPFTFAPAVRQSLRYALALDNEHFRKFSELRNHIESAYWHQAVQLLTKEDKQELIDLLARAKEKLHGNSIQIPHEEVWEYHTQMVEAIYNGDYEAGYQALIQHTDLLYHRSES